MLQLVSLSRFPFSRFPFSRLLFQGFLFQGSLFQGSFCKVPFARFLLQGQVPFARFHKKCLAKKICQKICLVSKLILQCSFFKVPFSRCIFPNAFFNVPFSRYLVQGVLFQGVLFQGSFCKVHCTIKISYILQGSFLQG